MLRILRAFGWLRWRVLLNSLERHGGRDALERFSLASEQLLPIVVALIMIPSALALAGAAAYAGWAMAQPGTDPTLLEFVRIVLLGGCVFAAVVPVLLPATDRTNAVRLLLLPIPRGVLYVSQLTSTLADPWMLMLAAVLIGLPIGLAIGGAPASALATGAASLVLLIVFGGIAMLVTNVVHLAVRDRRRGEILTLIVLLLLPMLGILPGVFDNGRQRQPSAENRERDSELARTWNAVERRALAIVPSEMYVSVTRRLSLGQHAAAARPAMTLIATAALLHALAYAAFARLLGSPTTIGTSRAGTGRVLARWRVPWVSSGTSAVAINQVRLALRTPRGRATILSPVMLFIVLALVSLRSGYGAQVAAVPLGSGLGVASFAAFVALIAIVPLAMNQFAIDRAGLTLAFLAPVETSSLLAGKAIGNGLVAAIPATACVLGAMALFRTGDPALWSCIPLSLLATYLLVAPVAAALSATFPRAVDMNSIGQGSNAHGAAGLLGTLAFVAAGAPSLLLVLLATRLLERPALAPLFLVAWTMVCAAAGWLLFRAVANLFERRRETLALIG